MNQEQENSAQPEIKVGTFAPDNGETQHSADAPLNDKDAATDKNQSELIVSDKAAEIIEPANNLGQTPFETGVIQLANTTVNKNYQTQIEIIDLGFDESAIRPELLVSLNEIGLTAEQQNTNTLLISGTPRAAGEFSFNFDYFSDDNRFLRKKLRLLVNPDPKSLWRNIEPPEDAPFPKPHQRTERLASADFTIAAASLRGRSHAHQGSFREDDFAVKILENGWHVLIVADGAGSAQLSRRGSQLACQTALEILEKQIPQQLEPNFANLVAADWQNNKELRDTLYNVLCGAAFVAHKTLEREAEQIQHPLKDFSTTLLMAIAKKINDKTFIAGFGIGDGAVAAYDNVNNQVSLLNKPDGGEFSGQTRFLTMPEVISNSKEMMNRIGCELFDRPPALYLMTDGISDPKFATDNNLVAPEKWREFQIELNDSLKFDASDAEIAEKLLEYMNFWSPGEHDDRTLAILF